LEIYFLDFVYIQLQIHANTFADTYTYTLYIIHYTLHIIHYTLYMIHDTLYIIHYTYTYT
jgi:hypothetical protein